MRIVTVALLVLLLGLAAEAQKARPEAQLKVVNQRSSGTANPKEMLYEFTVTVTNTGTVPMKISNNMFVLTDDEGKRYLVTRGRYPERVSLATGQSDTLDRIYFNIPTGVKPKTLTLLQGRHEAGSVKL